MKKTTGIDVLPLVVCDVGGGFLFLSSTSRKGYTKSIEQGALWVVHPETDRLLPSGKEAVLKVLEDRETYFYAEVSVTGDMPIPPSAVKGEESAKAELPETRSGPDPKILLELARLVAKRRQDLPQGSYTTHLFQSGLDKIRKKTGEEAVELILARKPEEVTYEAADLIYHLLVLLEAEGIGIAPVLEELGRRAK